MLPMLYTGFSIFGKTLAMPSSADRQTRHSTRLVNTLLAYEKSQWRYQLNEEQHCILNKYAHAYWKSCNCAKQVTK